MTRCFPRHALADCSSSPVYPRVMSPARRIFLLSPANCSGIRAGYLLRKDAPSPLAMRLRPKRARASAKSSPS